MRKNNISILTSIYARGEPEQQEKAGYWQTAIGLQAVDGLKVSEYLQDTARRHIEGEMMDIKKLKHRQSFLDTYIEPALKEKYVRRK